MSNETIKITEPTPATLAPRIPAWGWNGVEALPEGVTLAYGARAIYSLRVVQIRRARYTDYKSVATIDVPYDRQSLVPGAPTREVKRFCAWINKALPRLTKACERLGLTPDSRAEVTIERGGYKLVASPRASYGYLYIRAWRLPVEPPERYRGILAVIKCGKEQGQSESAFGGDERELVRAAARAGLVKITRSDRTWVYATLATLALVLGACGVESDDTEPLPACSEVGCETSALCKSRPTPDMPAECTCKPEPEVEPIACEVSL